CCRSIEEGLEEGSTRVHRRSSARIAFAVGAAAVAAAIAPIAATPDRAGAMSIRDDRDDHVHTNFGVDPRWAAVGGVTYSFGLVVGSGTLITPRWVLTAGHLVDSTTTSKHT